MKAKNSALVWSVLAATLVMVPALMPTPTFAQNAPAAQAAPGSFVRYGKLVDIEFVKPYAAIPQIEGVTLVDSRPAARKYDIGHIQTAINIPDSQFDKLAPTMLPTNKAQLIIFYCDGLECVLSHNGAFKAEKLGYTNIRVYDAGFPDWIKNGNLHAVSVQYIKKLMDEKAPMTLIDSRPKERKYDLGHIPGAISLPDTQFDKLAAERLPADKNAALYFYCEGLSCVLSNDSAKKAIKLGYTNVKVVPEGYPAWEKAYGRGPTASSPAAAKPPVIEAGKESGTITLASFERIYKEAPGTVHLIDVREPSEFASGTFKGAINMPLSSLEKNIDKLPSDKPIIFFCSAGSRSGEAYDMVKLYRAELKVSYLDASPKWTADGNYTIKGK